MTDSDMLRNMGAQRKDRIGPYTYLYAAADVAQWLLDYRRLSKVAAAGQNRTLSLSTIGRITRGTPVKTPGMYRALASVLRVPPNTFILILDGDVKGIRELVMLRPEEDEPIRELILDTMAKVGDKTDAAETGT